MAFRRLIQILGAVLAALAAISIPLPTWAQDEAGAQQSVVVRASAAKQEPTVTPSGGIANASTPVTNTQGCPDPAALTTPYKDQISKLSAIILEKDQVISTLQGDVNKKSADVAKLQNDLATRTAENGGLLAKLGQTNNDLAGFVKQVNEKDSQIKAARLKLEAAQARARQTAKADETAHARFQTEADALRNEIRAAEDERAALQRNMDQKNAESATLTKQLSDASTREENAATALKAKQLEIATKDARIAMGVVGVVAALPFVLLGLYMFVVRGWRREQEVSNECAKLKAHAAELRAEQCRKRVELLSAEEWLLDDLARNRRVLRDARDALRFAVVASIVCSTILTAAALVYLNDVSLASEKAELTKSAAWQALVALFTPVAGLVAIVTLAQTKYKDAVAHCIAAQLCHRTPIEPAEETADATSENEPEKAPRGPGIDLVAAGGNPRGES